MRPYLREEHPAKGFGSALINGDGGHTERCPRIGPTRRLNSLPRCKVCRNNGPWLCEHDLEDEQ